MSEALAATEAVLAELGLTPAEIGRLADAGTIAT
jgi:hypothetical protein